MWKLKKYRGKWAAVARINGRTVRRSSGTEDRQLAEQWLDDFIKIQQAPRKTIRELYEMYTLEKTQSEQIKLGHMWKNLEQHFANYRVDQLNREKAVNYTKYRQAEGASNNTIIRELGSIRSCARWFDKSYPKTWYMPSKPPPRS